MRPFAAVLAALVMTGAAGCSTAGGAAAPSKAPLPGSVPSARAVSVCPMEVPGTTIASLDTPSGADVMFTTSEPDRVEELRYRVRSLAELRNDRLSGRPPGSAPPLAVASMGAGPSGRTGASWASVEDVAGGARMVVTTENAFEVDRLRDSIRGRVQRLAQGGGCAGDWMP